MKTYAPLLAFFLLSGCTGFTTAVKRHYDFRDVRRIGIVRFDSASPERLAAEDLFTKHLLRHGYNVVERLSIESVLKEQRLGMAGLYSPRTAKRVGRLLGVDALLMGTVTDYSPAESRVVTARNHYTTRQPILEYESVRNGDGTVRLISRQVGVNVHQETREFPQVMSIEANVGIVAKLVDVETGEVLWVGSASREGEDALGAAESVAAYLVRQLRKDWSPSLARRLNPYFSLLAFFLNPSYPTKRMKRKLFLIFVLFAAACVPSRARALCRGPFDWGCDKDAWIYYGAGVAGTLTMAVALQGMGYGYWVPEVRPREPVARAVDEWRTSPGKGAEQAKGKKGKKVKKRKRRGPWRTFKSWFSRPLAVASGVTFFGLAASEMLKDGVRDSKKGDVKDHVAAAMGIATTVGFANLTAHVSHRRGAAGAVPLGRRPERDDRPVVYASVNGSEAHMLLSVRF